MENILRSNFKDKYEEIKKNIETANMIAIDSEFSGIVLNSNLKNSLFDVGKERYEKLKKNIEKFIAIQIGITTFHFDREENKYIGHVYNFYVIPKAFATIDTRFMCQASSLAFLAEYNFDFNKCFKEGISYLNVEQEKLLRKDLKNGLLFTNVDRSMSMGDEQEVNNWHGWRVKPIHYSWSLHQTVKLLQKELSKVAEWSKNNKSDKYLISHGILKNDDVLIYLFQKEVRKNFINLWTKSLPLDIEVEKVTLEQKKALVEEARVHDDLDNCIVDTFLGFTKVFRLLVESNKPIIGHNLLLDLMILYNQFEEPLPSCYNTFKKKIINLFPNVFDTKYISYQYKRNLENTGNHGDVWSSNILQELYDYFNEGKGKLLMDYAPDVVPYRPTDGPITIKFTDCYHVAGWDSYVSGFCFIKMGHYFAATRYGPEGVKRPLTSIEHIAGLEDLKNKVNIIRASVGHINLGGVDPSSNRPQALIVRSRTGRSIDSTEISEMLAKYNAVDTMSFGPDGVLVAVPTYANAREIMKAFSNNKDYYASRYNAWREAKALKTVVWCGLFLSAGMCMGTFLHWLWKNQDVASAEKLLPLAFVNKV